MEQHFNMINDMIKKACDDIDISIIRSHIDKFFKEHKHEKGCSDKHFELNASWLQKKTELQVPLPSFI